MNRNFLKTVAAITVALATQVSAGFIDITGGYNVLTFGDFSSYNDQTWGSLAASGNVKIEDSYSIGTQWAHTNNYPENALVAGGNVELTGSGSVWGGISAGGTINTSQTVHGDTKEGVDVNNIFNFDNAKSQLKAISTHIANETALSVEVKWGGMFFVGMSDADVNYFTVDADKFNGINYLQFENIGNSKVVITVTGKDVRLKPEGNGHFGFNGITVNSASNILWNISEATSLTVGDAIGTIIALDAKVALEGGNIYGDLISGSVTGRSEIHIAHYNGDFNPPTPPPSVPESSTTTMLVAGAVFMLILYRKNAFARK